jgi:hypothetical protein
MEMHIHFLKQDLNKFFSFTKRGSQGVTATFHAKTKWQRKTRMNWRSLGALVDRQQTNDLVNGQSVSRALLLLRRDTQHSIRN